MRREVGWLVTGAAFALFGLATVAPPAQAVPSCTVTGTSGGNPGGEDVFTCIGLAEGDELTVTVDQTVGPDTLQATAIVSIFDISNGTVLIDVDLSNDSSPGGQANRIVSFGFGVEPNALLGSIIDLSGSDTDALTGFDQSNFPGFQLVEFCATSGNNCAGGGSGGLLSGQQDLFRFSLSNGFVAGGTIDLSQFAFKFQGGAASYEKPGTPDGGGGTTQVPAPGTLVLLGTGLAGLAVAGRKVLARR
jgi:PEP-CTERM motif